MQERKFDVYISGMHSGHILTYTMADACRLAMGMMGAKGRTVRVEEMGTTGRSYA